MASPLQVMHCQNVGVHQLKVTSITTLIVNLHCARPIESQMSKAAFLYITEQSAFKSFFLYIL